MKMKYVLFYILISIISFNVCVSDNIVQVYLKQGILSGNVESTILKKQNYFAFKGIPYAVPPMGELRFKPPIDHEGWEGIYQANENKPTCLQYSSRMRNGEPFGISGSEDCLYLSVFTPSLEGSYPVIVFDYNDNFRTGFNGTETYSPDFFIEEDVIVVTINHRLGVLGYLNTDDEVIPANVGIKDFIQGLKWVKNNIKKFGGDPDRVTLMGNRGGATLVNILLYSKNAKGLFSNAIMQSGTAMEPTYFYNNSRQKAFELGELFDIKADDDSVTLLQELQKLDAENILRKETNVIDDKILEKYQMSIFPFAPVIENDNPDAILTKLPENADVLNDVPILIGMNSREGLDLISQFIFEPRLLAEMAQDFLVHFPIRPDFRFDRNNPIFDKVVRELKEFYFEEGYLYYGNILEYAVYVGDILQNYALDYAAKKFANTLQSPVYYYMFDFRGLLNENSEFLSKRARSTMKNWGATIGDELCYLHLCSRIKRTYEEMFNLVSEQAEVKVMKRMVRLWTNFARTGNPTPTNDDNVIKNFTWQPMKKNSRDKDYLHITKTLRMKTNPLNGRDKFWDEFLDKYSQMAVDGVVRGEEITKDEL